MTDELAVVDRAIAAERQRLVVDWRLWHRDSGAWQSSETAAGDPSNLSSPRLRELLARRAVLLALDDDRIDDTGNADRYGRPLPVTHSRVW